MGNTPLPQKQLFTVRQIVIALSIVACLVFIFSYSGRVVLNSKVENQKESYEEAVTNATLFGDMLRFEIDKADDPDKIADFARNQRNMGLEGDQVVITDYEQAIPSMEENPELVLPIEEVSGPQNWQLWWELMMPNKAKPSVEN